MDYFKESLKLHKEAGGKVEVVSKVRLMDQQDLSLAYTPGVAEPCREIHKDPEKVYTYTAKKNLVAVVSNGTAVLGLGNIGAAAAIPVMEGKSVLFKEFGGVDAFPICLDITDTEELIRTVQALEPVFGGINLEDIAAPQCFEVEKRLKETMNIPVFHDDQHGTAVVVLAAMLNALKVVGKDLASVKIAVNGAGAAAMAVTKLLLSAGAKDVVLCDSKGIIVEGRPVGMNAYKEEIAKQTNPRNLQGTLADALVGADVFIGLSAGHVVTKEMAETMAEGAAIFAMANPIPEIEPDDAKAAGAAVIATGRSDYPNQINNVLAFPGIFRGALDARASDINEEMKLAAAHAIAALVGDDLSREYIIPGAFDKRVAPAIAKAVYDAAVKSGVARL